MIRQGIKTRSIWCLVSKLDTTATEWGTIRIRLREQWIEQMRNGAKWLGKYCWTVSWVTSSWRMPIKIPSQTLYHPMKKCWRLNRMMRMRKVSIFPVIKVKDLRELTVRTKVRAKSLMVNHLCKPSWSVKLRKRAIQQWWRPQVTWLLSEWK